MHTLGFNLRSKSRALPLLKALSRTASKPRIVCEVQPTIFFTLTLRIPHFRRKSSMDDDTQANCSRKWLARPPRTRKALNGRNRHKMLQMYAALPWGTL